MKTRSIITWSIVLTAFLPTACGGPGQNTGAPERMGTSLLGNCSFDSVLTGETCDTVILDGRLMDPESRKRGAGSITSPTRSLT